MNFNANELREIENIHIRAARNLLAEKGNQNWNAADQAAYDRHLDAADLAREQRDRASLARYSVEIFLRKSSVEMSGSERRIVQNWLSTTTPSEGGYTVPFLASVNIISVMKDACPMRRAASQMFTATGANMNLPSSDGTSEMGEQLLVNVAATTSDPTFSIGAMPTYRYSSKIITFPIELLQDMMADPVEFVSQRAMDRIGRIQNQKFTNGNGTTEPTGFLTVASIGKVATTGQAVTVAYDDLVDLSDSVDAGHPTLSWQMSQTCRRMVRRIKDTAGRPIWEPSILDNAGTQGGRMLGYEVQINNDIPVPAANAKSIAFGNFKKYMIRDAANGLMLFRFDDGSYARNGQVAFLALMRSGGNLLDSAAIKVFQHSAT